jgi:hypothetical protein
MKLRSFQIEEIESHEGLETVAFSCWLSYEGRKITSICNEGKGESHKYKWKNKIVEGTFQPIITDEMVWDLVENKLPLSEEEVKERIAVGR